MLIKILVRLIMGYVRIEVEGYYIERFINICLNKKILIWNIKKENGVKVYLNIGIRDFKKLSEICRKTKCKVKIKGKRGVPFFLDKYKKRKIFIIFCMIILVGIYCSSRYIWNIDIEVEENLEVENIRGDLEKAGLKLGILKNNIDTQSIVNKIRLERNDISWMGIDIEGTNVIVRLVKSDEKPQIIDSEDYCNIVAQKSGIITKITAQNGTAIAKVGDTVKEGTILIAGYIDGKYTGRRYVHSIGEIEARVWYTDTEKIYFNQEILKSLDEEEKRYSLKINNFQINFYKTLSNFEIYDTIYNEKKLQIFSNFYLPISIIEKTNKKQEKVQKKYSLEEAKSLGIEHLKTRIEQNIENKENILRCNRKLL